MPCHWVKLADGTRVHVNMGRGRTKPCAYCPQPSSVLCDAPTANSKTCDRPCCRSHAKHVGPDRDLCRDCAQAAVKAARETAR